MSEYAEIPLSEQACQQDILRRVHQWLGVLEQRIVALLQAHDPEAMKPGECEQAISRHLVLMIRLLQLRQQYVQVRASASDQALFDALLSGVEGPDHGSMSRDEA